jgi:trehalose/maltose transport system substrate-binding protein
MTTKAFIFCLLRALVCVWATSAWAVSLTLSCGNETPGFEQCERLAQEWASKGGHTVKVISTPNESNEVLALYQQLLSAQSSDLDIFPIDIVWPGILANHLLDLSPHIKPEIRSQYFPAMLANNTIGGQLKALPWFADVGLLYYRKDLLAKYQEKVPETWEQLVATARLIQHQERQGGNKRLWGYVFQARAYEGLSCNALEWVDSFGGGRLIADNGMVSIFNQKAIKALDQAASWVGQISPKGVLNYAEEEARGSFQAGYAVFMRNWPYAWALLNSPDSAVAGKIGVAPLPSGGEGGKNSGVLGGWAIAVSRYSKHPAEAAELALLLTSMSSQKERAVKYSYNPTMPELYVDDEVARANAFMTQLYDTLVTAVARPSSVTGSQYGRVSNEFWNAVHSVLSGKASAEKSLRELEAKLKKIRGDAW